MGLSVAWCSTPGGEAWELNAERRGVTGQGITTSKSQRHAARLPHDCTLLGVAVLPGTTEGDLRRLWVEGPPHLAWPRWWPKNIDFAITSGEQGPTVPCAGGPPFLTCTQTHTQDDGICRSPALQ